MKSKKFCLDSTPAKKAKSATSMQHLRVVVFYIASFNLIVVYLTFDIASLSSLNLCTIMITRSDIGTSCTDGYATVHFCGTSYCTIRMTTV